MTLIGNVGKLTRYAALVSSVLALVALTRPDGSEVLVNPSQVYWIAKPTWSECQPGANSRLSFGAPFLCVRETPEQIKELFK